jgi:type IV pilus assembly protein PilM
VTESVARSLSLPQEQAERLKRGDGQEAASGQLQEAARVAVTRAAAFADEIRSSLDFYQAQTPGARVGRVLLTGGGSKLPGLLPILSERLPSQVAQGRPFHRVTPALDLSPEAMAEAEPLLAVAVGLALPGVRG